MNVGILFMRKYGQCFSVNKLFAGTTNICRC